MKPTAAALVIFSLLLFLAFSASSQCVLVPVSLEQRVAKSASIAQGRVVKKQTYLDPTNGYVYTRNTIAINAWLKNHSSKTEVEVITLGGVFGDKATKVYPSLQLDENSEYIFFLESTSFRNEDKRLRLSRPGVIQTLVYADMQGALKNERNNYKDLFARKAESEEAFFSKITRLAKSRILTPAGKEFAARKALSAPTTNARINALDNFSPTSVNAGTLLVGDRLTITGSGFGTTAGTVSFTDADDGGASFYTGLPSDVISWSDNSITVRVPANAGTGPIRVDGPTAMVSSSNLTVGYAHFTVDNTFSGFSGLTSQRFFLRNLNSLGGYTFLFNNTFNLNTPAVTAFTRAMDTWVCATGVNFRTGGTTSATAANDGVNVVSFNTGMPVGVLGRATSANTANATGGCNQYNTVWWTRDIDIEFANPPYAGYTWEYGPANPSGSEFDFESVTVHELGHAIGLGHRIAPGAVMHYALFNGSAVRTPNAQDIAGVTAKLNYSTNPSAPCFNPATAGSAMTVAGCTLPVTFLSFSGERLNTTSDELNWAASNSNNNAGYSIERSADGNVFHEIGFLQEKNPSTTEQEYQYTDNSAGPYPWYYRLKQTDLDGDYTYSKIIFVKGNNNNNWRVFSSDGASISLYGNPVGNQQVKFQLMSASGQTIIKKEISNAITSINASQLAKGVYYYKIVDNSNQSILSGSLLLGK